MAQKFYLTTPIYYVNARPHIGHAYTTIVADVLARRHRLLGDDTFFLTGTDEHGQKIERSAAAAGIPPQQFADEVSQSFRDLWLRMGITNDRYIRTTDEAHKRGVQKLFADLYERGQIYLSSYTGQYSIGEEMFVDGPPGTLGPDGKPTETVTEENFFFRLSDFQLPLLDLIESDTLKITPESRKNEVLSFLRGNVMEELAPYLSVANAALRELNVWEDGVNASFEEALEYALNAMKLNATIKLSATRKPYIVGALKDLSISRSSFTWGIPVPQPAASTAKEKHVIYVWLDALANYMTALGYGSEDPEDQARFDHYWPADLHLVGKEIIRFHCVYWPAFLLALNPRLARTPEGTTPTLTFEEHRDWAKKWLPNAVTAHGWLLFDDAKMSKSKGNIVRTETILEAFGTLCPPPATPPPAAAHPVTPPPATAHPAAAHPAAAHPATPPPATAHPAAAHPVTPPPATTHSAAARPVTPPPAAAAHPAAPPLPAPPSPLFSSRSEAEGPASSQAATASSPVQNLSIPGKAKEPAFPLPSTNPSPAETADLKGTASAVPQTPPEKQGASAPEVSLPTPPLEPTKQDRDLFAADILRYFLLREIPFGQDGSFSFEAMITRYNADLANGYGNLVSRTLKMIQDNFVHGVPIDTNFAFADSPDEKARFARNGLAAVVVQHVERCVNIALSEPLSFAFNVLLGELNLAVTVTDRFISENAPWKLAKLPETAAREKLTDVLAAAAESIRIITALLYPILPYATAKVWHQLGLGDITQANLKDLQWGGLQPGTKLGPLGPIFPRADKGLAQIMADMELRKANPNTPEGANAQADTTTHTAPGFPETPIASDLKKPLSKLVDETTGHTSLANPAASDPAAGPRTTTLAEPNPGAQVGGSASPTTTLPDSAPHTEAPASGIFAADQSPQITIDDFAKTELRVAKIILAERIPKADKLLRLEVDLGYEKRQILSGIAEWYTPEDLLGRRIVVITNLAPRKMRGLESHGMLLAASTEGGKPHLATFTGADDLPLGSRLK